MEKMRDWSKSKYKAFARISKETHEWIKTNRGNKSIAGKLDEIITFYQKNGSKKLQSNKENKHYQ